MMALPLPKFFPGRWGVASCNFSAVETYDACNAACLANAQCVQVTWLVRPVMPCSCYVNIEGAWPPPTAMARVRGGVKCGADAKSAQSCAPLSPLPPTPPPPAKPKLRAFEVKYSCGGGLKQMRRVLGPDSGNETLNPATSFAEAAGNEMFVGCTDLNSDAVHFARGVTTTYRGAVQTSWRVFPTMAQEVDRNQYTSGTSTNILHVSAAPAALEFTCTRGTIKRVTFASYGKPLGTAGNFTIDPACHNPNSSAVVRKLCVGKQLCTVVADSTTFGRTNPPGESREAGCRTLHRRNSGPERLAIELAGCESRPIFALNVTIPVGAKSAQIVFPAVLLKVAPDDENVVLTEGGHAVTPTALPSGDLAVVVASGTYSYVLSSTPHKSDDEQTDGPKVEHISPTPGFGDVDSADDGWIDGLWVRHFRPRTGII